MALTTKTGRDKALKIAPMTELKTKTEQQKAPTTESRTKMEQQKALTTELTTKTEQ
jgi:hypothetical protein